MHNRIERAYKFSTNRFSPLFLHNDDENGGLMTLRASNSTDWWWLMTVSRWVVRLVVLYMNQVILPDRSAHSWFHLALARLTFRDETALQIHLKGMFAKLKKEARQSLSVLFFWPFPSCICLWPHIENFLQCQQRSRRQVHPGRDENEMMTGELKSGWQMFPEGDYCPRRSLEAREMSIMMDTCSC